MLTKTRQRGELDFLGTKVVGNIDIIQGEETRENLTVSLRTELK